MELEMEMVCFIIPMDYVMRVSFVKAWEMATELLNSTTSKFTTEAG
jgi:hypothetical protein